VNLVGVGSSQIEPQDRDYLEALASEWAETLNRDADELLDSLCNLAVGPIRAGQSGLCTEEQLQARILELRKMAAEGRPEDWSPEAEA
jgi:hypothetical protein